MVTIKVATNRRAIKKGDELALYKKEDKKDDKNDDKKADAKAKAAHSKPLALKKQRCM